jgi:hypothetical protein
MTDENGTNGGNGGTESAEKSQNNDQNTGTKERVFTQAELDKHIADRLKGTVSASEFNKLKTELDRTRSDFDKSKMTEAERREKEIADRIAVSEERAQKAEGALRVSYAKECLMEAGFKEFPSELIDRVIGQTDEDTKKSVAALKKVIDAEVKRAGDDQLKKGPPSAGQGTKTTDKQVNSASLKSGGYTPEEIKRWEERSSNR